MQRDAAAAAQKGAAAMSVRKGMTVASSRKGTAARQKGMVKAAAMAEPQQKGGVQATGNAELVESSVTNASFLQSGTPTSMGFFPPGFQANHPAFTQESKETEEIFSVQDNHIANKLEAVHRNSQRCGKEEIKELQPLRPSSPEPALRPSHHQVSASVVVARPTTASKFHEADESVHEKVMAPLFMSSWLLNSTDPSIGADKRNEQYWGDVIETYNQTTPGNRRRNQKQAKDRWHKINRWTDLFHNDWLKARRVFTSGYNDQMWIDKAHHFYVQDNEDLGHFVLMDVWYAVRNEVKWVTYNLGLKQARKRKVSGKEAGEDIEHVDVEENAERPRPMGQKQGKKVARDIKANSKLSDSDIEELQTFGKIMLRRILYGNYAPRECVWHNTIGGANDTRVPIREDTEK
nr:unnamed protein product [Digitaria exilis]